MRQTRKGPELYAAIRLLHWEGKTAKEAAAKLGIGVSTLNEHRRLLDLPPFSAPAGRNTRRDSWSDHEVATLVQAIAGGETPDAVAQRLGRTVEAVFKKRYKLGLPRFARHWQPPFRDGRPSWPAERVQALASLRRQGHSFAECASRLGTARGAALGAAHRYLKERA